MQKLTLISIALTLLALIALPATPALAASPTHWSLLPLNLSPSPQTSSTWPRNSIDHYILAQLKSKNISPSPRADPTTLVRRLYFDLIGLPPTPEQIDAFVADSSPAAYARLVDKLLASPRYGERWARHWLDIARYTESDGFERDQIRNHAWHYRDYVINAFNADTPYNQFITEQIAADALEPDNPNALIPTSFLICGAHDRVGSGQKSPVGRARVREDELEGMIATIGQTFLGLTLHCARCHDHKLDPITTTDYYQLKSIFDGVWHGKIPPRIMSAAKLKEFQAKQKANPTPILVSQAYAGIRKQPQPTHLLLRGDATQPQQVVAPAPPAAIQFEFQPFDLAPDSPEASRRIQFAQWLTHPKNPLTARVMVNRLWRHHFATGIVNTPSDFGSAGSLPSHPQLLDHLANYFIQTDGANWSIKQMHRLMLNSATYQQASTHNANAAAIDPDNRLLWRFTPKRLEAEAVRDSILAVSGKLNLQMHGPGYRPFDIVIFNAHHYHLKTIDEPKYNRRTVYRINVNSAKGPLLETFDCPDPSVHTPNRRATTTPLQALALMNNPFIQNQANHFATRMNKRAGANLPAAIKLAYRHALGRTPTETELQQATTLAQSQSLTQVCWALLNASEFLYVK